jgi:heavy metal translocating P-type ATPase
MTMTPATICAHCGLAVKAPDSALGARAEEKSFCCSGCAFVYQLAGGGEEGDSSESWLLVLLAFGVVLSGFIMTFSWVLYLYPDLPAPLRVQIQFVLFALSTPVILGLGYPYLKIAAKEVPRGRISMATLIALGTLTAYAYSAQVTFARGQHVYFDTASMVIVLVTLGKYLQARARARMARAMRTLGEATAAPARRVKGSKEEFVSIDDVRVGDVLRAFPAEKIAVDGQILEGSTTLDESFLTGESLPVSRGPGDRVLQGSLNLDGAILYQAVQVGEGTLQSQIERMCAEAMSSRMPLETLVDKASAWFVGATIVFAALILAYDALLRHQALVGFLSALAILVVACPCALGIATPMATFIALQRAAREGVLIRSPECLERMFGIDTIVFDKTGTLTEGKLQVVDAASADAPGCARLDPVELLQIAASLETLSEHHLGRAILQEFKSQGGDLFYVTDFVNHPGEGIEGTVAVPSRRFSSGARNETDGDIHVHLGTAAALAARGLQMPEGLDGLNEHTTFESRVYLGWDGWVRGVICLQDQLRSGAQEVISQCRRQGLQIHLVSGDREASTREIAQALHIQNWAAEKLPAQKVEYLEMLQRQGRKVAMVGDGQNDAPALAKARIGIAHQIGTDLSKEAADVHILAGDLALIPWSLMLARKTLRHIRQNLFWAFLYNVVAIALAAMGFLKPVMAAAAMLLSSLIVAGNSLRLERVRRPRPAADPIPQRAKTEANPVQPAPQQAASSYDLVQ